MTTAEYIKQNTIEDQDKIQEALCLPLSARGIFKVKPLVPIGIATFKGDSLTNGWSCNKEFETECTYPIYHSENGRFAVGKSGKGMKFVPAAWKNIKWF